MPEAAPAGYNERMSVVVSRIPVVAGCAYIERVRRLPSSLTVALQVEQGNRYLPHAVAVLANGEKVGYVAPEVARSCYEKVASRPAEAGPLRCPARRASHVDHETSGIELLLDFSGIGMLE
jgi:hypothetical protein